jgi:hypothetical protein
MTLKKTFIIVLSLLIAFVLFSKQMDQCCSAFANASASTLDQQIEDDNTIDADEPIVLSELLIPYHPVSPLNINGTLAHYHQPDMPVILKPPRV